jgi:hypothetical protein
LTPLIASILLLLATAALPAGEAAEMVLVEGLGPTSLRGFDCTAIGRSALVSSVCHDPTRDLAIAVVGGRTRAYCDVPRELIDAWLAAPSMGRFHAALVDPAHRCD